MQEYKIIIKILLEVLSGKNLTESFNGAIDEKINISKIKDIAYGVLRNFYFLEAIFLKLVTKEVKDIQIKLLLIVAFYEIKFTQKPVHAITSDLVNLSYEVTRNQKIKGFVNAVIRTYLREKEQIESGLKSNRAAAYNFPLWWIKKIQTEYPNDYQDILLNSNLIPKTNLRVNLRKISQEKYIEILKDNGIEFTLSENKISLDRTIAVKNIPFFSEGFVSIQDLHAQKLADLFKPNTGDYILDACAAPGGKTCQLLENFAVDILASDISKERLNKVEENLKRLGLKGRLQVADARSSTWWDKKEFDAIIADVPCSASGTLKHNPDIKLQRKPEDIANFVKTQRAIVENLWPMLKVGGMMVYITCSIFREENELNIAYFQQNLPAMQVVEQLQLLPTRSADGFFYCVLTKNSIIAGVAEV